MRGNGLKRVIWCQNDRKCHLQRNYAFSFVFGLFLTQYVHTRSKTVFEQTNRDRSVEMVQNFLFNAKTLENVIYNAITRLVLFLVNSLLNTCIHALKRFLNKRIEIEAWKWFKTCYLVPKRLKMSFTKTLRV